MTVQEQEFDKAFKSRGGFLGRNAAIDFFRDRFFNESKEFLYKVIKSRPTYPDVVVDLIKNKNFGAVATKRDSKYFIGVYYGTIPILFNLFARILSSNKLLIDIGDSTKESETRKIFNAQITDLNTLVLLIDPKDKIVPNDPIRITAISIFVQFVIDFILAHEYGHIVNGHLGYLESGFRVSEWSETKTNLPVNKIPALLSQTLEADADLFATKKIFDKIRSLIENKNLPSEIAPFFKTWETSIRYFYIALYTQFRLFGLDISVNKEQLFSASHPPPITRFFTVNTNVYTLLESYKQIEVSNKVGQIMSDVIIEVGKIFQEISEQPPQLNRFRDVFSETKYDHSIDIILNWNNVYPLIMPYAHGKIPSLFSEEEIQNWNYMKYNK